MPVKKTRVVVVEVDAQDRTTGALETLYFSDWRYITGLSDTPSRKRCQAAITESPTYERFMHGPGKTMGPSTTGVGSVKISNQDARYDYLRSTYRFAGFGIRVYTLANSKAAYSTRSLWLSGIQAQPTFARESVEFRIKDRERKIQFPLNKRTYLGTGGREGPTALAGRNIPRALGIVYGIQGELVDPTFLIFQVNDGPFQKVVETYDGGYDTAYNTAGTDAADFSALRALVMTSAEVATCYASGYIRLGSAPVYGVTFDIQGDKSGGYGETLQHLLYKSMVTYGTLSGGDLYTGFTAALDAISTDSMGIYLQGTETDINSVMDKLLESVAAYRIWDRATAKIKFGRIASPTTAMVDGILPEWAQRAPLELRASSDENEGIPPYAVRLRYKRNYTAINSFAPLASAAERDRQAQDWAQILVSNLTSTLADYPDSDVLEVESMLVSAQAASTVAQFIAGIRSKDPDFWDMSVPTSRFTGLDLGQVKLLRTPRFGYTNGKPVLITGIREDLNSDVTDLQLWRPSS